MNGMIHHESSRKFLEFEKFPDEQDDSRLTFKMLHRAPFIPVLELLCSSLACCGSQEL